MVFPAVRFRPNTGDDGASPVAAEIAQHPRHQHQPTPCTTSPGRRQRTGNTRGDRVTTSAAGPVGRPPGTAHHVSPALTGEREALRILLVARQHATTTRTAAINLFKSLLLTAPDACVRFGGCP
jgi:hypothetical protein